MRRILVLLIIAGVGGWALVRAYRAHVQRVEETHAAAAPVVAPTRLSAGTGEVGVTLDSAGMANASIRLAAVRAASAAQGIILNAVVVPDPAGVAVIRAPLSGRLAAAPGGTWPSYGDVLHEGDPIAVVADARPLAVPRTGMVTRVIARPGEMVQAGDPLLELADFTHPVVSIAWVEEAPASPPSRVTVVESGGGPRHSAAYIGPAPDADPLTHRPAALYRVGEPWSTARPGLLVTAEVPNGSRVARGAFVPAQAVVQWDGLTWAWVRRSPGHFARVRVLDDNPLPGGWLVTSGLAPGDSIVITGAQQLLSEEFRARITVGDEVAE